MGLSTIELLKQQMESDLERIVGDVVRGEIRKLRPFLQAIRTKTHKPWITATLTDDWSLSAAYLETSTHPFRTPLAEIFKKMKEHKIWKKNVSQHLTRLANKHKYPHFVLLDIDFLAIREDGPESPVYTQADITFLKSIKICYP